MIDSSELDRLEQDLERAARRAQDGVDSLVNRAGLNMKRDWARAWTGIKGMPALGRAVSYDQTSGPGWSEVEVGPDKDKRQGALGNIAEFGTSTQAPKRPAGEQVLKAETERVDELLAKVGAKL